MDWNWTEATNEEFNARRMTETYYRIYHIVDGHDVNVYKFWAKSRDDAYAVLTNYRLDHVDGNTYFYSTSGYYGITGDDRRFDTLFELTDAPDKQNKEYSSDDRELDKSEIAELRNKLENSTELVNDLENLISDLTGTLEAFKSQRNSALEHADEIDLSTCSEEQIDEISDELNTIDDVRRSIRNTVYLNKTKHNYNESWSIDYHILEDLKHNIPRLIADGIGIPNEYYEAARAEASPDMSQDDISKLALKKWHTKLNDFLLHIKLYEYYRDFGISDDTEDAKQFDAEWHQTLPVIPGTNNEIDYVKLSKITQNEWGIIWDTFKEIGQMLWD